MTTPKVSILVVAYKMPHQALNTLYTLSAAYQRGVAESEYEVVIVENASDQPMDRAAIPRIGGNIRHVYRHEAGVSPVPALTEAYRHARAPHIGIMIDGARMVTPGLMRNVLDVFAMDPDAVVVTMGYHLGERNQQEAPSHSVEFERALLDGLPQRGDGYRLFDISCLTVANPHGCLHPMMEANTLFVHRDHYDSIGGADERFDQVGGGMVNLDLYRELCELPRTTLWTLPGEGSFHQFHGGVTTRADEDREQLMREFQARYEQIRGKTFRSPISEPHLFGEISDHAMWVLRHSAGRGVHRFVQRTLLDDPVWADEVTSPRASRALLEELATDEGIELAMRTVPSPAAPARTAAQRAG